MMSPQQPDRCATRNRLAQAVGDRRRGSSRRSLPRSRGNWECRSPPSHSATAQPPTAPVRTARSARSLHRSQPRGIAIATAPAVCLPFNSSLPSQTIGCTRRDKPRRDAAVSPAIMIGIRIALRQQRNLLGRIPQTPDREHNVLFLAVRIEQLRAASVVDHADHALVRHNTARPATASSAKAPPPPCAVQPALHHSRGTSRST